MKREVTLLLADDDPGHTALIERNLRRAGITNQILQFADGQLIVDFLFGSGFAAHRINNQSYLLLLDIRMPKIDGIEVLRRVKSDGELKKLPVIMLTTTDDPREVTKCHELGCSNYIVKPIAPDKFIEAIQRLGLFLSIVEIPPIDGN